MSIDILRGSGDQHIAELISSQCCIVAANFERKRA